MKRVSYSWTIFGVNVSGLVCWVRGEASMIQARDLQRSPETWNMYYAVGDGWLVL